MKRTAVLFLVSRIVLYAGAATDMTTTQMVKTPELNPVLGNNPARQIPIMVGSTVLIDYLSLELKKDGHPKLATAVNFVVGSVHIGAGAWNMSIKK